MRGMVGSEAAVVCRNVGRGKAAGRRHSGRAKRAGIHNPGAQAGRMNSGLAGFARAPE
jgi:hypothetical protein